MQVSLEYTLCDTDGNEIDSNVGGETFIYTHGAGQIVSGLEKALEGKEKGDSEEVTVSPEEGYGLVDDEAFVAVPFSQIPEDSREVGAQLQTTTEDGLTLHPVVAEVNEDEDAVILNFNHPLAGATLVFKVKVLDIIDPEGQESKAKTKAKTKKKAKSKSKKKK